jgi:pimeloyl-ACP methyl ester carboxylesterase
VLVDPLWPGAWSPLSEQQKRMLARGAMLSRRGAFLARIGLVRFALRSLMAGSRFLPRVIGRAAGGRGMGVMDRLAGEIGKMPRELWPMVIAHWSNPDSFLGMAVHLAMLPAGVAEALTLPPLPNTPVTVLTGARNSPMPPGALAAVSPEARHIVAANSGHWVHLDQPDLVIQAIQDVVSLVRASDKSE